MDRKLSRFEKILAFIIIILVLIQGFFIKINIDSVWNYNYSKSILYNKIPYSDFSFIVPPLSAQINALFLWIFGDQIIVIHLLRQLSFLLMLVILYFINKDFKVPLNHNILGLFAAFLFMQVCDHNSYNVYVTLSTLLLIYLDLQKWKYFLLGKSFYKIEFFVGIAIGIVLLNKQNIGIAVLLSSLLIALIMQRTNYLILDKIILLKMSLIKLSGLMLIIIPEILYLYYLNSIDDFIYCILILPKYFQTEIFFSLTPILIEKNYSIMLIFLSIILALKKYVQIVPADFKNTEEKIFLLVVILYTVSFLTIIYPKADLLHTGLASIVVCVLLSILIKDIKLNNKILKTILPIWIIFIILILLNNPDPKLIYLSNDFKIKRLNFVYINKKTYEDIITVGNYILAKKKEGQQIMILSGSAPLYTLPFDIFNSRYDPLILGNVGPVYKKEIEKKVRSNENIIFLIEDEKFPKIRISDPYFRELVKKNLKLTGSIGSFSIYSR